MHAYKKDKAKPTAVNNNNKGEGNSEDIKTSEHNGHVKVNGHICNGVNGHIGNGYSNGTLSNGLTKASLQESHDVSLYQANGISSVNGHFLNSSTEKEKMQ